MQNPITDVNEVLKYLGNNKCRYVGIDGIDGVGKTSLAKELEKIGYFRISLDDYLKKKSGGYYQFIDYKKLNDAVTKNKDKSIVIEGVLLLKILRRIDFNLDYFVYITDNVWLDDWNEDWEGKYLSMSLDEIIRDVEQQTTKVSKALNPKAAPYSLDGFRREMYEYAFHFRPWNQANIILRSS